MASGKISGDPLATTTVGLSMAAIQGGANVQAPSDLFASVANNLSDLASPATALSNLGGLSSALAASTYLTQAAAVAGYQPLDADLTSWAGVTRAAGFDTFAATPSSANLAALVTGETGTGALVFGTSPTLTTPALGTPTALVLTNATGTPTSIGLANGTGLPVATGISGLGAGVATFLATPSSANLATAVTGETGTGALVFGTAPTLDTPTVTTRIEPTTDDGAPLGTTSKKWSDAFFADGAVLNFNAGNYTVTHSTGALTFNGAMVVTGLIAGAGFVGSTGATGGVGYATGAGGTVTQITSKSTGVTLNKACGQITLNGAALASGGIVSFVLTSSAIAATDTLILNHISVGTFGGYYLNGRCTAGSATIDLRNQTGGSLSEAIVVQFALIKAVNA